MGYLIKCNSCKQDTWASNIVDLVNEHTEKNGKIKCTACGSPNASIYQKSKLQEKDETWERYIKGVIPIKTEFETYTPYVF
jgi:DNA-directed RNA polymerase subunit RPC12/RpoP